MSYEIIYRKAVVRCGAENEKFTVPIIEMGSNNCYEQDPMTWRERRERSRGVSCSWVSKSRVKKRAEEQFERVKERADDDEREEIIDYDSVSSQYRLSLKFPWKGTLKSAISYLTNANIDDDIAEEYVKIKGKRPSELTIEDFKRSDWWLNYYDVSGIEDAISFQKSRRSQKPKKAKKEKERNFYILFEWERALLKKSRWGVSYSLWKMKEDDGIYKAFETEKEARKWGEDKLKNIDVDWEVVRFWE